MNYKTTILLMVIIMMITLIIIIKTKILENFSEIICRKPHTVVPGYKSKINKK